MGQTSVGIGVVVVGAADVAAGEGAGADAPAGGAEGVSVVAGAVAGDATDPVGPAGSMPASSSPEVAVQPKMPFCAAIIRRAVSWNSGAYDAVPSSTTTHSKPRSLASRTVVWTHTSVVTPQTIRWVIPAVRRMSSKSVA
jgi:hypothetical protein